MTKKYDILAVIPSSFAAFQVSLFYLFNISNHWSYSLPTKLRVAIISVRLFQLACACKDIDLISFDASNRPIQMNRKAYNLALANHIYFEVPYAPAIEDSRKRRHTIQTAHDFHTFGKSKVYVCWILKNVLLY